MDDVLLNLRRAMMTASNDDLSEPGTAKRERHVERLAAMSDAIDEIERVRAALAVMERERDYWHEWFVKADENNSLLANSRVISTSREI